MLSTNLQTDVFLRNAIPHEGRSFVALTCALKPWKRVENKKKVASLILRDLCEIYVPRHLCVNPCHYYTICDHFQSCKAILIRLLENVFCANHC